MWPLDADAIARLTGGRLIGDPGAVALRATTDTRAGVRPGDLFVALVGPHFDANAFALRALGAGATVALVSRELMPPEGCAAVVVTDTLAALQDLARAARRGFAGRVVAITGSNGKTTVKEMLACALSPSIRVTQSPQSFNSQVGVALSLLGLDPAADVAVVECGISLPGEMARIAAMVAPDAGVFVNVGDAHLEGLNDRATTAREKASLFAGIGPQGWVIVPSDDVLARAALERVGAPCVFVDSPSGRTAAVADEEIQLPPTLPGPHIGMDAALAAVAAWHLGAALPAIEAGLQTWHPSPMRMEITTTPAGVLLINDAYTADPVSADAALVALAAERDGGATIAVLAGMAQLGSAAPAAHRALGRRVVELGIDRLIGLGDGGSAIVEAAVAAGMGAERVRVVSDVRAVAALIDEMAAPGDRVLLKGSRPAGLEALADELFAGFAPTRLYVDLDALVANYLAARSLAGSTCTVMPVIKSSGYGMSAVRVARALEKAGATWFCVAYPDEGVTLRRHGVTADILVQNVLPHEVAKVVSNGLSSAVGDPHIIAAISAEAGRQRRQARVHIEVDTGMARTGVDCADAAALAMSIVNDADLRLEGVMTHFAAADDPAHDAFTQGQADAFERVVAEIKPLAPDVRWIHASNTAGLSRFPDASWTMARLGIGLYGYGPHGGDARLLQRPALRLVTRVVASRWVEAGASVGYGRSWVAPSRRCVAVVALGYNDGYPRALSNRGVMSLRGVACPVVGRVCMDVSMIDVTDVPGGVTTGEEVVVFGPGLHEPTLEGIAAAADTIPYELMTRLSPRVRRIYATTR